MTNKELKELIESGDVTNEDVAYWLGWIYIEKYTGRWRTSSGTILMEIPNWLGCTDDALSLVPAGWSVFTMYQETLTKTWGVILERWVGHDCEGGYEAANVSVARNLPSAVVLAVLEIEDD